MKPQATLRTALTVFAFGLSLSLTAVAAPDPCVLCGIKYAQCLDEGAQSEQVCKTLYRACLRRGDGQRPCPL